MRPLNRQPCALTTEPPRTTSQLHTCHMITLLHTELTRVDLMHRYQQKNSRMETNVIETDPDSVLYRLCRLACVLTHEFCLRDRDWLRDGLAERLHELLLLAARLRCLRKDLTQVNPEISTHVTHHNSSTIVPRHVQGIHQPKYLWVLYCVKLLDRMYLVRTTIRRHSSRINQLLWFLKKVYPLSLFLTNIN